MNKKHLLTAALIGAGAVSLSAQAVPDQPKEWEKCAGVAKKGKNDCGALDGSHKCAGQAKDHNMDTEWVYVPKGTCDKLTGGMVKKVKPAKK
ncbi:BufA1 family periplasmic bufferin-type metallophore [Algicola sagamiensis]|uniref:BufA1 family periplasmic bufferin-type metallophore n=1 Tax=Algicola sagamiensis TaxID=163869 RepID=UPI0003708097|nr:DUF2282 domain-containing protein [Algicola sagamiensis]